MEAFTLDRTFHKRDIVDGFLSLIWTERYYGDGEVELVVPVTTESIQKLSTGTFLGLDQSKEVMILETMNIEDNTLKVKGTSLLPWFNNRFLRVLPGHEEKSWRMAGGTAGWMLWVLISTMCLADSPYLTGEIDIGIPNPQVLAVPGLGLNDYDQSGGNIDVVVPFGPLYTVMKDLATTYEIGMSLILENITDTSFFLGFRSYKGMDRTSGQTDNPVIRFSPLMDSFTDIKELQSIASLKTLVYAFATQKLTHKVEVAEGEEPVPDIELIPTTPGISSLTGLYTGFDLRALMIFADDISYDTIDGNLDNLTTVLNSRAYKALTENHFVIAVDGEIVPDSQFKYGVHYNLGDLIEVQGNSGVVQTARITEYIRSQDPSGEKAYPTVTMIG